jgi:hypothetical protein
MRQLPLIDLFGALLTLVKAAFLFLSARKCVQFTANSYEAPKKHAQFHFCPKFENTSPILGLQDFSLAFFLSVAIQGKPCSGRTKEKL